MKLRYTGNSMAVTLLCGGAALGFAFLLVIPTQQTIRELRQQIQDRRTEIVRASEHRAALTRRQDELDRAERYTNQWQSAAPHQGRLAPVLVDITDCARQSGTAILRLQPSPPVRMQTLSYHNVDLEISGTFAESFEFVRALEQLPATMWISDLTLRQESQDESTLRGRVTLRIFADIPENPVRPTLTANR